MSNTEASSEQPDRAAFAELESAVAVVLKRLAAASSRATDAESKSVELEEIVRRFTGDEREAGRLLSRLSDLEAENLDLKTRLETGREGIDRLLAKVRYLEEQR